jgi:hypothetical protein
MKISRFWRFVGWCYHTVYMWWWRLGQTKDGLFLQAVILGTIATLVLGILAALIVISLPVTHVQKRFWPYKRSREAKWAKSAGFPSTIRESAHIAHMRSCCSIFATAFGLVSWLRRKQSERLCQRRTRTCFGQSL